MAQFNRPRFVIDNEYHKRFIENHCQDYCKVCPERFRKITTNLKCHSTFTGSRVNTHNMDIDLLFYCMIEGEQLSPAYKERDRKIQRSIGVKKLHEIYDKEMF